MSSKVFNINRMFKVIPFVWGDYNGERFRKSGLTQTSLSFLWVIFWWVFTIYDFLRYTTLGMLSPEKRVALDYYLADYCSILTGEPYRLMISVGPLYNVWLLGILYLFHKLMGSDARYRYWLRYFQIPTTRTPDELRLPGYTEEKLAKFWEFSSRLQSIAMKVLFGQALFTMGFSAVAYAMRMQKYHYLHSPFVFWLILIVNALSLTAIGTMNFLITHAPVVLLYLNCKILEERIDRTSRRLHHLSFGNRFNSSKVDRYLHDLGTIFDEVQRCNFFWCRYLGMNYFIAIAICCIVFLCSIYTDDFMMTISAGCLFVMTYFGDLVVCFTVCGQLQSTINHIYGPLTNLLANKRIKLSSGMRIVRILEFIKSEHAGFRCSSLFLIRKDVTMQVFFAIITHVILLYVQTQQFSY